MSLQGNLRDFSVTEILQLLGTQKKTGCLELEWNTERAVIFMQDGAIVSTRNGGVVGNEALLQFLRQIRRLSDEQLQGLVSIQKESNRDLEDVLLKGRYMDALELGRVIERQILDALAMLVRWENGTYRFDANRRWPGVVMARLSVESALMEALRRVDEHKRFIGTFKDAYQVLGIRDLPDPDVELSEEERELFGLIDGHRTILEIVATAPLTEYETHEALDRMLNEHWVEVIGHRDPGEVSVPETVKPPARRIVLPVLSWTREVLVAVMIGLLFYGLALASKSYRQSLVPPPPQQDGVVCTRLNDVRYALELYRRDRGAFPATLQQLVEDDWLPARRLEIPGYLLVYQPDHAGTTYSLDLASAR